MPSKCKNPACNYFAGPTGYCKNHGPGAKAAPKASAKAATRAPADPAHVKALAAAKRAATLRDKAERAAPKAARPAPAPKAPAIPPEQLRQELADLKKTAKAAAALRLSGNIAAAQAKDRLVDMMVRGLESMGQGAKASAAEDAGRQAARAPVKRESAAVKADRAATDRGIQRTMDDRNRSLAERYAHWPRNRIPQVYQLANGQFSWRSAVQASQGQWPTPVQASADCKLANG